MANTFKNSRKYQNSYYQKFALKSCECPVEKKNCDYIEVNMK